MPTQTHRVIADLVANGYMRMVVTANFDRPIEMAVENAGIVPNVASTPDDIEGMLPLVHTRLLVVKVKWWQGEQARQYPASRSVDGPEAENHKYIERLKRRAKHLVVTPLQCPILPEMCRL